MAHEHGEYDHLQQKWFCGYWMSHDAWMDIHDYAPASQKSENHEDADQQ